MPWPPLLIRLALTASGTARLLSILLLILSLAPWASIYALLVSMHANGSSTFMNIPGDEITLSDVLKDENATIEDLWLALFRDRAAFVYKETLFVDNAANTVHHWTIVLPWGISLAFGIIIPFLLTLCSYIRDDYPIDSDEDPWISRHRKERRLSRLIVACEDYRKVSGSLRLIPILSITYSYHTLLCCQSRLSLQRIWQQATAIRTMNRCQRGGCHCQAAQLMIQRKPEWWKEPVLFAWPNMLLVMKSYGHLILAALIAFMTTAFSRGSCEDARSALAADKAFSPSKSRESSLQT